MRNIVLIVFGLAFSISSNSQDYIPMLGDSNVWYILSEFEGYSTEVISTLGDTIIDERQYVITDGAGYLYEDTVMKKVYARNHWWETEILLYDFSIEEGDSILLQKFGNGGTIVDHSYYKVDSMRPFQLTGLESRAIYLTGEPINWGKVEHAIWIEGVGSMGNFNYPAFGPEIHDLGEIACYYKNGELLYQSSLSKELGGCDIYTPFASKEFLPDISIYPNPFIDQITIEGILNENLSIEILDIFGRRIYINHSQLSSTFSISTNKINSGQYIVRIRNSDTGSVVAKRIIVKR